MMDHQSLVTYEGGSGGAGGGSKYKECMRNHAAAMGGQAFDGCGEYLAASPDSLNCAACGYHRSLHRRAPGFGGAGASPVFFRPSPPPHSVHLLMLQGFLPSAPPPPPHLALPYHAVPAPWHHHVMGGAARAGSETPPHQEDFSPGCGSGSGSFGRKRVRNKFTLEQKERMRELAEKQGWRINRNDDDAPKILAMAAESCISADPDRYIPADPELYIFVPIPISSAASC